MSRCIQTHKYGTKRVHPHALYVNGLPCVRRQGFAMHYTSRVCHALHGKGLPCITRQGFAMHYTAKLCHALHGKGLPCIARQGFAVHYWPKSCTMAQTMHWTLLGCVVRLTGRFYRRGGELARIFLWWTHWELLSNSFSPSTVLGDLKDFRCGCLNHASVNVGMQARARSRRTRVPMLDMINFVNSLRRYNVFSRSWCQSSFCK